jgi:hypothetical protein
MQAVAAVAGVVQQQQAVVLAVQQVQIKTVFLVLLTQVAVAVEHP